SSVDALRGEGMELQAVAVTVIGGTLLSGGYGSVVGTVLGAITFGMIQVGLVLAGAPGHFFRTLAGIIVVGAVILHTSVARRKAAARPPTPPSARAGRPRTSRMPRRRRRRPRDEQPISCRRLKYAGFAEGQWFLRSRRPPARDRADPARRRAGD